MEQNELDPVVNTAEETDLEEMEDIDEIDTVSEDMEEKQVKKGRLCVPCLLVWTRYLFPFFTVIALLVASFFYNVMIYSNGKVQELSVFRLYINTFKGTHNYLGGATNAGRTSFYAIVTGGAIVGLLCFLIALFLTGLAAYTAVRAFRAGHESEESDRMKVIFKIAFSNRVWLFLSNLLILVPLFYPYFFSFVGSIYLAIGGEDVIFILFDRLLLVGLIAVFLMLVIALIIPRFERRKKMNMFLLHRMEEPEADEDEEDEEAESLSEEETVE